MSRRVKRQRTHISHFDSHQDGPMIANKYNNPCARCFTVSSSVYVHKTNCTLEARPHYCNGRGKMWVWCSKRCFDIENEHERRLIRSFHNPNSNGNEECIECGYNHRFTGKQVRCTECKARVCLEECRFKQIKHRCGPQYVYYDPKILPVGLEDLSDDLKARIINKQIMDAGVQ